MCYLKHFYVLTSIGVLYDNNQSVSLLGEKCGLRGDRSKQDNRGINKKIRICTSVQRLWLEKGRFRKVFTCFFYLDGRS
jgi:hypothetical protein